jgi:hypothetical protein
VSFERSRRVTVAARFFSVQLSRKQSVSLRVFDDSGRYSALRTRRDFSIWQSRGWVVMILQRSNPLKHTLEAHPKLQESRYFSTPAHRRMCSGRLKTQ